MRILALLIILTSAIQSCRQPDLVGSREKVTPKVITQRTATDSDDPAIWVDPNDPGHVLILGTDKGDDNGGIYVFDLAGVIDTGKSITGLQRPNNVDVEYACQLSDSLRLDIAVFAERGRKMIRVLKLPDMEFIDGGGIAVFQGEPEGDFNSPMGVSLFRDPATGIASAIVSRKNGPTDGSYLWQYVLESDSAGNVTGTLARKFGNYIGQGEIEAIAVDDTLGFLYFSDEAFGIRKYLAHPDSSGQELGSFGTEDFKEDREGIAIWPTSPGRGYLVVSDQQDHSFAIYSREGSPSDPHAHKIVGRWYLSTEETDGCELYAGPLSPGFPGGIFIAMSENGVFHYYDLGPLADSLQAGQK